MTIIILVNHFQTQFMTIENAKQVNLLFLFFKGGRQSCQYSKPQLKIELSALRIISQQKFLVGALVLI